MDRAVVMDFDDLCQGNDPLDDLRRLKDRDPGFKVTLFAIPLRMPDRLVAAYEAEREWIALAVHGWRHARHECLGWTSEETADKLGRCLTLYPGFSRLFKAPNWNYIDEVYEGCKQAGFAVADHIRNYFLIPEGLPHYVYNMRLRNDRFRRLHGHIQPGVAGDVPGEKTGLTENPDGLGVNPAYVLPIGTRYVFAHEAVSKAKELAV